MSINLRKLVVAAGIVIAGMAPAVAGDAGGAGGAGDAGGVGDFAAPVSIVRNTRDLIGLSRPSTAGYGPRSQLTSERPGRTRGTFVQIFNNPNGSVTVAHVSSEGFHLTQETFYGANAAREASKIASYQTAWR